MYKMYKMKKYCPNTYKLPIILQLVVVFMIFLLWWWVRDFRAGWSAILGGLACILPSWYFMCKLFGNGGSRSVHLSSKQIIKNFYVGELIKLLLSVIMLVVIIKYFPVDLVPVICGYIGGYLSIWLVCFWCF